MKSKRGDTGGDACARGSAGGREKGVVLLSFDIEEFDLPREHGGEISVERGVEVSSVGLSRVLEMLERTGVKATFFVTGNFAETAPELTREILKRGHEVGCHGVDHFRPRKGDATRSSEIVGEVIDAPVYGYRQPRMFPISYEELSECGYLYDSSVNPAFIPGRYNHFDVPRRPFTRKRVVEVPTSVATRLRVPLFWLALHLFPLSLYLTLCRVSLRETGYLATYFHPWEFSEIRGHSEVPFYIKRNSGEKLVQRLEKVVRALAADGYGFITYREYVEKIIQKKGKV